MSSGCGPRQSCPFFTIEEIGGSRQMTGGAADSCSLTTLDRNTPSPIRFRKGGIPDYGFDQAWLHDPVLRLPSGTWRLTVRFEGSVPACEGGADVHDLTAENVIRVR